MVSRGWDGSDNFFRPVARRRSPAVWKYSSPTLLSEALPGHGLSFSPSRPERVQRTGYFGQICRENQLNQLISGNSAPLTESSMACVLCTLRFSPVAGSVRIPGDYSSCGFIVVGTLYRLFAALLLVVDEAPYTSQ